jgi:hypothetical protein
MGIFHPADQEALIPDGAPDPWLNLLAEVTGALPLVLVATLLVVTYGADRLANRDPPSPHDAGLPPEAGGGAVD